MAKKGIIKIRTCPECGQKQLGIVTEDGKFLPLYPGMYVEILEEERTHKKETYTTSTSTLKAWLPEELKKNKVLRIRYGVIIKEGEDIVDASSYRKAFIKKLQGLVEKESFPDLAVVLDKYFHSPHLAAGNSAEITLNLIRDIDEIRKPIELMERWLNSRSEESFSALLEPFSKNELTDKTPSDEELIKELSSLTLEDFFESLKGGEA